MSGERTTQGDLAFIGVDAQSAPSAVKAGLCSDALNNDFRNKTARTRPAFHVPVFTARRTMDFDNWVMPYNFDGFAGLGTIYGVGEFSDPGGYEYGVLAGSKGTWIIRVNCEPAQLPYAISEPDVVDDVVIKQAFGEMLLFAGDDRDPMMVDPVSDEMWSAITQTASRGTDDDNSYGDGTYPIPGGHTATVFNNRVLVGIGRDEVAVSDILDYTRYSRAFNRFFINSGSDDYMVRIYPFNQTTLVVFKNQSVYLLGNMYGDLADVRSDVLTHERGCIAAGSVATVGKDVWFLSEGGVYSIGQALENLLQARSVPVSDKITPYFNRINWFMANKAQAVVHDNRYILAVPLDSAQYNNALFVYDFLNQEWAGVWQWDLLDVKAFMRLSSPSGKRDLYVVSSDNLDDSTVHGAIWKMGFGRADEIFGTEYPIESRIVTRGYGPQSLGGKFLRLELVQSTWNPSFTVTLLPDGVNEDVVLVSGSTKNRQESYVFGAGVPDYLNANGNHGAAYRKDYSVFLNGDEDLDLDVFDFDGFEFQAGIGDDLDPHLEQTARERYAVKEMDRNVQVKIENAQGCLELRKVITENVDGRVQTGSLV